MDCLGRLRLHFLFYTLRLITTVILCLMFVAQPLYAQNVLNLPVPGAMVSVSPAFAPTLLLGLEIDPNNPFKFQFIVDHGDEHLTPEELKKESEKVIRYFLAGLAVPEDKLWVNLSPYEGDRIVDDVFGQTEMGRDLLAQDYMLKQITASLIYPEDELGRNFWKRIYQKAFEVYGTTTIPVNTFNKVWIVPDKATVYAQENKALVIESSMNVMLESDYLAEQKNFEKKLEDRGEKGEKLEAVGSREHIVSSEKSLLTSSNPTSNLQSPSSNISTSIVREIVVPELIKEVNNGKNFTQLRQIYHSLILANWFKKNLQKSIFNKVYSDHNKVGGISIEGKEAASQIYAQYLAAYKKGVCDVMKIEYDPYMKKHVPRKYFSGGFAGSSLIVRIVGREAYEKARAVIAKRWNDGKRIFYASGVFWDKLAGAVAETLTPTTIRNSALAAVFSLIVAAAFNPALSANTIPEGKKVLDQLNLPGYVISNNTASGLDGENISPWGDGNSGDDGTAPPDLDSDEGFFKDMSIVDQQKQTVAGISYKNVSYTQYQNGQKAKATLYSALGQEIGELTVSQSGNQKMFVLSLRSDLARNLGVGITVGQLSFNSERDFELGVRNLLLVDDVRAAFANHLLTMFDRHLNDAGLVISPEQLVAVSQQIKNMDFKTQQTVYIRENAARNIMESPNYYHLTIFQPQGSRLVDDGFSLHFQIMLTPRRPPMFSFRAVKSNSDGTYQVLELQTENFSQKVANAHNLRNFPFSENVLDKVFGRLRDNFKWYFSDVKFEDFRNEEDRKIVSDIWKATQPTGSSKGEPQEVKVGVNPSLGVFTIQPPSGSNPEEAIAKNGSATFKVSLPGDSLFYKGETVWLGDGSGTMIKEKLQALVKAFQKVWSSNGIKKVFIGDVVHKTPQIEETPVDDFLSKTAKSLQGYGATHIKQNFPEASDRAGKFGTVVYVGDFRPDSLAVGIQDWSYEDVEREVFNPLLEKLKTQNQRFIGYYIETLNVQSAFLVEMMEAYAKAHPKNPIFFIIRHEEIKDETENASVDRFASLLRDQYEQSEAIANEIVGIPIGDLTGLDSLQVALRGKNGDLLAVVDGEGNPLENYQSNDTISPEQVKGEVEFDVASGNIKGYSIPKGSENIVVKVIGKEEKTSLRRSRNFDYFPLVDESKTMKGRRIGIVQETFQLLHDTLQEKIIGMGKFKGGSRPDVQMFNGRADLRGFLRHLSPEGGTELDANLRAFLDIAIAYCEQQGRPQRGDPGFRELHVPVLTDGQTSAKKTGFDFEYIKELKRYGIVIDLLVIDNASFKKEDYVLRLDKMFTGAIGLFELAAATGGIYENGLSQADPAKIYQGYIQKLEERPFLGKIPEGIGYVEITAYDKKGGILDQGIYRVKTQGDLKKFMEGQLKKSFQEKIKQEESKILSPIGLNGQSGQGMIDPATGLRPGETADVNIINPATDLPFGKPLPPVTLLDQYGNPAEILDPLAKAEKIAAKLQKDLGLEGVSNKYFVEYLLSLRTKGLEDFDVASFDAISKTERVSSSGVNNEGNQPKYGGIDFNEDQFNLKTQGKGIDMNMPFDESMLQDFNPDMIAPIIIQIVPITNPQMILGLSDQDPGKPS